MGTERTTRRISSTHQSDPLLSTESSGGDRNANRASLMAKLAQRQQQLLSSGEAATVSLTPPPPTVVEGEAAASHGTRILRRQRAETLTKYPEHEKVSLKILRQNGLPAVSEDCVGADELLLTEDHMVVRFDYHTFNPADNCKHRYLIDIDMSYGQLVDHTITHLGPSR